MSLVNTLFSVHVYDIHVPPLTYLRKSMPDSVRACIFVSIRFLNLGLHWLCFAILHFFTYFYEEFWFGNETAIIVIGVPFTLKYSKKHYKNTQ